MPNYNSNLQTNNTSLQEILDTINELPEASNGVELPELTNEGSAADLLAGKELIDSEGNIVEGAMPIGSAKTPATTITKTPTISVNSSGLITSSVTGTQSVTPTVSAGYISSGTAGTITVSGSATKQLTTQSAKTITPTKASQTAVSSGVYTTGDITVAAIPSEYVNTSDATATADELFAGETSYGANGKITGTFTIDNELTDQGNLLKQLQNALQGKAITPSAPSTTVSKKDVNFYDYDGTLLYSYTVEEAQALTELPALPTQSGLICQGWNYDLDTIKSHNRAVNIGATYITDDGKTRLYIRIAAEGRMTVPLYFSQTVANGVTIDWGDGSATETLSGTGNKNTNHTYTEIGDYVISLEVTNGVLELEYSSGYNVMGNNISEEGRVYSNMLQKAEIGNSVTVIGAGAFYGCHSLTSIVIPNSITVIDYNAFSYCYSLTSIVIPNSITVIDTEVFYSCHSLASVIIPNSVTIIDYDVFSHCYSLTNIVIPDSVTSINFGAFVNCSSLASIVIPNSVTAVKLQTFSSCHSLASIVIPNSVTSIGNDAFGNCSGMAFYDFTTLTSVPTLSNTNAFTGIPSDCVIKVPAALYDEWIAATNWSTYASQIVAV